MVTHYSISLDAGGKWSAIVGKGKAITLTATEDRANVSALIFHAHMPSERYNMPDTLKAQHTALLTAGNILMSDQGKALVSITEDSVGWHDPLAGYTTRAGTDKKYGFTNYQMHRNEWLRSGEENFKVELYRHHLSPRDLCPPVNFFSKVIVDHDGTMSYQAQKTAGKSVTLRTEMDVLIVLSNTPNPLDPEKQYPNSQIKISITDASPVTDSDDCVMYCAENKRAFENTWSVNALMKGAN